MANDLAILEPIPLPDLRRVTPTPSWPPWLAHLIAAVRSETQIVAGEFREDIPVLPPDRLLTAPQRTAVRDHLASLRSCLEQTPANGTEWEVRTAKAVTKMLLVLPSMRRTDVGDDARSEVFLDVLDDVPCWAVESATRRWYRHEAGMDERGRAHDYKWAPDPGTLRRVALSCRHEIAGRALQFDRLLEAREFVDCSAEEELGRKAMRGLFRSMAGTDPTDLRKLTFDMAVKLADGDAVKTEAVE